MVLTGTAAADVSDATEASGYAGDVAGFIVLLPIFLDNLPRTFGLEIPVNTVSNLQSMIFGGLIIFFLIVEPRGLAPVDLSVNIQLPPLERHRAPIRRELAKVHAWFDRGDWKGGFEEACKLLEKSARDHLRREARAARVQVPGGGGAPRTLAARDIARMPLGALADVFCKKLIPSQIDAHLCTGLKRINPDRINVAHQITTQRTERKLRDNVGRHMWTIDNLLREIPA